VTLRGLARAVGVSPSLVSQIETGKSQPSVSTLYSITKALGISVEDVFDAEAGIGQDGAQDTNHEAEIAGPAALSGMAVAAATAPVDEAAADPIHRVGPLVRPAEREVLELDSGVTWERLGHVPGTHVDFLLVTYAPGGCSSSSGLLMRHAGVEYGYIVEGELRLTLGFEEHILGPGDAISFPSSTPHRYRNEAARPATGVWYVSEPDETRAFSNR
jgi:transcriptional regulator with XRE-family HTH domain